MFKNVIMIIVSGCLTTTLVNANPMRPDNISVTSSPTTNITKPKTVYFNLSDISITGELRYANINRQLLTVNDRISGYQVIQIESDYVLLTKGNSEKKLYLTTPGSFKIVPSNEDSPSE